MLTEMLSWNLKIVRNVWWVSPITFITTIHLLDTNACKYFVYQMYKSIYSSDGIVLLYSFLSDGCIICEYLIYCPTWLCTIIFSCGQFTYAKFLAAITLWQCCRPLNIGVPFRTWLFMSLSSLCLGRSISVNALCFTLSRAFVMMSEMLWSMLM